jgi:hypothetical protein
MARIRVNTEDLKTKAKDFESAADAFGRAGDEIAALAMTMPSYDGQLSSPARKAGYEIQRQSREMQGLLQSDAQSLKESARAFDEVDNQSTTIFNESLVLLSDAPLSPKGGKPRGLASMASKEDGGGEEDSDTGQKTITFTNSDGSVSTIKYNSVLCDDGTLVEYRDETIVFPDGTVKIKNYEKTTKPDGTIVEKTTLSVEDIKTQEDIDNWYKQAEADEEFLDSWFPGYDKASSAWDVFKYRILKDYSSGAPPFSVGDKSVTTSESVVTTFPTGATQTKTVITIKIVAPDGTVKRENTYEIFM